MSKQVINERKPGFWRLTGQLSSEAMVVPFSQNQMKWTEESMATINTYKRLMTESDSKSGQSVDQSIDNIGDNTLLSNDSTPISVISKSADETHSSSLGLSKDSFQTYSSANTLSNETPIGSQSVTQPSVLSEYTSESDDLFSTTSSGSVISVVGDDYESSMALSGKSFSSVLSDSLTETNLTDGSTTASVFSKVTHVSSEASSGSSIDSLLCPSIRSAVSTPERMIRKKEEFLENQRKVKPNSVTKRTADQSSTSDGCILSPGVNECQTHHSIDFHRPLSPITETSETISDSQTYESQELKRKHFVSKRSSNRVRSPGNMDYEDFNPTLSSVNELDTNESQKQSHLVSYPSFDSLTSSTGSTNDLTDNTITKSDDNLVQKDNHKSAEDVSEMSSSGFTSISDKSDDTIDAILKQQNERQLNTNITEKTEKIMNPNEWQNYWQNSNDSVPRDRIKWSESDTSGSTINSSIDFETTASDTDSDIDTK